ncbi:hypothetical protein KCP76_06095 [Salmonella enterica subsp. enterica serovar Weltevreden]|nr:hypothetical protein KCP76_06095 [Salmonella enterica subsp. enterica serovar Weltevreden]
MKRIIMLAGYRRRWQVSRRRLADARTSRFFVVASWQCTFGRRRCRWWTTVLI